MGGPKLSVVGVRGRVYVGAIEVVAAPSDQPPFDVDVIVEEEDRHLVLSAPAIIPEHPEHPIRVMTALWESEARGLGDVVVRRGHPPSLLAIVHDLDREPTVALDTVRTALAKCFEVIDALGAKRAKLPLLGTVHGTLTRPAVAHLVGDALRAATPRSLTHLWLVTPDPDDTLAHL